MFAVAKTVSKIATREARKKLRRPASPISRTWRRGSILGTERASAAGVGLSAATSANASTPSRRSAPPTTTPARTRSAPDLPSGAGQGARTDAGARRGGAHCEPRPDDDRAHRDRGLYRRARCARDRPSHQRGERPERIEARRPLPAGKHVLADEKLSAKPLATLLAPTLSNGATACG